jgi:signal transduction histidine kinase
MATRRTPRTPRTPRTRRTTKNHKSLLKQFKENTTEEYLNQLSQTLESLTEKEKENFLKKHYEEIKKYFGKDGELVNDIVSIEKKFNEEIEKNKDNKERVKELEAEKRKRIDDFVRQQRGKINTVLGILKKLEFEQQKKGKSEEELKKIREKIYKDYFKEVDNILDLINEAGKEADRRLGKRSKLREVLEKISAYRERHPVLVSILVIICDWCCSGNSNTIVYWGFSAYR